MEGLMKTAAVAGLQKDLPAMSIAATLHGGWHGPQDHDIRKREWRDRLCETLKEQSNCLLAGGVCPNQRLMTEGGKSQ